MALKILFAAMIAGIILYPAMIYSTTTGYIKINELMPSNASSLYDDSYKTPDWIELYNLGNEPINLSGYRVFDKNEFDRAWQLPDTIIKPKSHIVVYTSAWDTVASNKFTIESSGRGAFSREIYDRFNYNYIKVIGDFTMSVTVTSVRYIIGSDAHAGLHIRESLDSNSRFVAYYVMNQNDNPFYWLNYRDSTHPLPKYKFPGFINHRNTCFIRLWRTGEWIYTFAQDEEGYVLEENRVWFPIHDSIYVGLAAASNNESKLNKFTFSDLKFNGLPIDFSDFTFIDINTSIPGKIYKSIEMHTNFKLDKEGETIYLWDNQANLIDSVSYPVMPPDVSYGRVPDGTNKFYLLSKGTPNISNNIKYMKFGIASEPVFHPESGMFQNGTEISIHAKDDETVYYTIDGSEPDSTAKLYLGEYININKTTVLKAKAYKKDFLPSVTAVSTYFVNDSTCLPIVSISSAPENFTNSDSTGLFDTEYFPRRITAHFELFNNNFEQNYYSPTEIRLIGKAGGRLPMQPSLRLDARSRLGNNEFGFPFFNNNSLKSYQTIVLRNSGNDWYSAYMRDAFCSKLAISLGTLDAAEYVPSFVYINGKFSGLYNLREHTNESFFSEKYKIESDSVNIYKLFDAITAGSIESFVRFCSSMKSLNPKSEFGFDYINRNLDLDNVIDYTILQFFESNFDWPNWNIKVWQSKSFDSRWRFVPFDMDWTFGLEDYNTHPENNCIIRFFDSINAPSYDFAFLVNKILENDYIRYKFINRSADLLNTKLSPDPLLQMIDSMKSKIDSAIPRQRELHPESCRHFYESIESMKNFANKRPEFYRRDIVEHFGLSGISKLKISTNLKRPIKIKINSVEIDDLSFEGIYFNDVPIDIELVAATNTPFLEWSEQTLANNPKISIILSDSLELKAIFDTTYSYPLVVNEIMYKTTKELDSEDWIELYNPNNVQMDISGWLLKDDNDKHIFDMPNNTKIDALGYIVVVENKNKFQKIHPSIKDIIGEFDFGFGLEDMVRLYDKSGIIVDSVKYSYLPPWDPNANETGRSLELINPELDNLLPENWRASLLMTGTPGTANSVYVGVGYEIDISESLTIWPNPANNYIHIKSEQTGSIEYNIKNIFGMSVKSGSLNINSEKFTIDISSLNQGTYFVIINSLDSYRQIANFIKLNN